MGKRAINIEEFEALYGESLTKDLLAQTAKDMRTQMEEGNATIAVKAQTHKPDKSELHHIVWCELKRSENSGQFDFYVMFIETDSLDDFLDVAGAIYKDRAQIEQAVNGATDSGNHEYKIKSMKYSDRELALRWWDGKSSEQKTKLAKTATFPERNYKTLTGREIEWIWRNQRQNR